MPRLFFCVCLPGDDASPILRRGIAYRETRHAASLQSRLPTVPLCRDAACCVSWSTGTNPLPTWRRSTLRLFVDRNIPMPTVETQRAASLGRQEQILCLPGDAARCVSTECVAFRETRHAASLHSRTSLASAVETRHAASPCRRGSRGAEEVHNSSFLILYLYRSYIVLIYFSYTSYITYIRTI